ncbi:uncharacterized protein ASPGLDRAFT_660210 [Aspergillus glaucus CBS 516.65]|uniref:Uncharacterized protein n=1 Tax=Aspergillus glaucus CBS 516.65 TaxID=1160497 RepID=A0A1L9VBM6_ASPGL|nr:hypothetical protein ASPGLDRAFT_660210 [Aspergillus glaucus CBS 516.65]OJJ81341.1 hypothetical protein ASPGLDRAFT_660210 [Aspergillus glaucus CBS 516.65]
MTAFCPVEEGRPMPRPSQSHCRPVPDNDKPCPPAKQQQHFSEDETEITLFQAMESNQIVEHATPGSLTRHFLQKHVNPPWPTKGVECNICGVKLLEQKVHLLNHAERCHGTVVRGSTQGRLALECQHQAGLVSL